MKIGIVGGDNQSRMAVILCARYLAAREKKVIIAMIEPDMLSYALAIRPVIMSHSYVGGIKSTRANWKHRKFIGG